MSTIFFFQRIFILNTKYFFGGTMCLLFSFPFLSDAQSVLFVGGNLPEVSFPTGLGFRLMWVPGKSAFRSGSLTGTSSFASWDLDSIGEGSVAFGNNVKAKGENSMAWGNFTGSLGSESTAGGYESFASGKASVVLGSLNSSLSFAEIALGLLNRQPAPPMGGSSKFHVQDLLLTIGIGSLSRNNGVELFKSGNLKLLGALAFQPDTVTMKSDNQVIQVSKTGYKRVASNTATSTNRTALLSNGLYTGQMLYLECACAAAQWELANGGNVNLPSIRTFSKGTIMKLLWNGSQWLEMHYNDN